MQRNHGMRCLCCDKFCNNGIIKKLKNIEIFIFFLLSIREKESNLDLQSGQRYLSPCARFWPSVLGKPRGTSQNLSLLLIYPCQLDRPMLDFIKPYHGYLKIDKASKCTHFQPAIGKSKYRPILGG